MSARARAVAVVVEVEGESLEPSCFGEGEGRSQRGMLKHAEDPSKVDLRRRSLVLITCFFNNNSKTQERILPFPRCQFIHLQTYIIFT